MCCNIILYLCSVAVLQFGRTECISFGSVVRFSCNKCHGSRYKCCVGVLIAPDVAISTSYCAESCQFVIKSGNTNLIINAYSSPFFTKGTLGLIYFHTDTISKNYVKLSSIETISAIGLKAHILNTNTTSLESTLILRCNKDYAKTLLFHICTGKNPYIKLARKLEEQGIPLLLNDRLIGVSGSKKQKQNQHVFLAVGPHLSWISSTIQMINNEKQKSYLRYVIPSVSDASLYTETTDIPILTDLTTLVSKTTEANLMAMNSNKIEEDILNQTIPFSATANLSKYTANNEINVPSKAFEEKLMKESNMTVKESVLFTTPVQSLVKLREEPQNSTNSTPIIEIKSTTRLEKEKALINDYNDVPETTIIPTTTITNDAMQWFEKFKKKLKDNPPAILILTTSAPSMKKTTEFIDLT